MPHYFTNDYQGGREYTHTFRAFGKDLTFASADGVFSKNGVDKGTAYLLEAIIPLLPDHAFALLDMGCGYGAIGITAAAVKSAAHCTLTDVNERAVELARANARRNGVSGRVSAVIAEGAGGISGEMDFVATNPPFRAGKQVVLSFFHEGLRALKQDGTFFAVLRKQQGAESYIKALEDIFGGCRVLLKKKGYVVVAAKAGQPRDGVSTDAILED